MKTNKRKTLCLFILALIITVCSCITAVFAEESAYISLTLDTQATASIDAAGETAYFSYMPTQSGVYTFSSVSSRRECDCYLYDSDMNTLTVALTGTGLDSNNFKLSYTLSANTNYCFGVKLSDVNRTGTVKVLLVLTEAIDSCTEHDFSRKIVQADYLKSEADCINGAVYYFACQNCGEKSAEKTYAYGDALGHKYPDEWNNILPPDCTQRGLKIKICPICTEVVSEILPPTGHVDANSNSSCDNCNESLQKSEEETTTAVTTLPTTTSVEEATTEEPAEVTTAPTTTEPATTAPTTTELTTAIPTTTEPTTTAPTTTEITTTTSTTTVTLTTQAPTTIPVAQPTNESGTVPTTQAPDPSEDCECMCHEGGILWGIIRFFFMIFGVSEECVCGAEHY